MGSVVKVVLKLSRVESILLHHCHLQPRAVDHLFLLLLLL